jgi:SOS-response transcriptional repressor LexA
MSDSSNRLKQARERAGYSSAKAAAEAMNVPVATYIQHENGNRGYPATRAERYARFFRVSPEWLLYGKGSDSITTIIESPDIPVLGRVAAGVWLEETFAEPDLNELPRISYDRLPGQSGSKNLFAVELAGDSMNLAFPPNSILICERVPFGFAEIREGDFVIVERENHNLREMTCKKIALDENGDFLLQSQSSNPKFSEPIRIPRSLDDEYVDNGVNLIGKVVRAVQDFSRN